MEELVTKPWGFYQVLSRGDNSLSKHLMVYPGKRTSLQKHQFREEIWKVLAGKGKISVSGSTGLSNQGTLLS